VYVLELAGQDDRFATAEAATATSDCEVVAPGLALTGAIDPDRVDGLAFTHRASELIGRADASIASAEAVLEGASLDRTGSVAVRARDVRSTAGVDTRGAERALGDILVDRGFSIDLDAPDHELRALFADDVCALGWLVVETERGYSARAPTDKPFFQPGSMDPLDARAVANLAGAASGVTLFDPMCGTGGILVEAGLRGATVIGADAQPRMVAGARTNLEHYLDVAPALFLADAGRLPLGDRAVDAIVFDTPYGRQSKIAGRSAEDLVAAALQEAHRVADRGVVIGDRPLEAPATDAGWTVSAIYERPVHRSLTRYVHVLGQSV